MNLFKKKETPQLDIETAGMILAHTFEKNQSDPNTIPLEVLASYSNYRRERFTLQRTILVIMIVLFLLLPLLFIPPVYTLSSTEDENGLNPVYRLELKSFMLVGQMKAQVEGHNVPVYETDSHIYLIEPTKNGQMVITITLLNGQTTTEYIDISNVDKTNPEIEDHWIEKGLLYIRLSDDMSGVSFDEITGINADGETVKPLVVDENAGHVAFEDPRDLADIYIPDQAGNVLQVMVATQQ